MPLTTCRDLLRSWQRSIELLSLHDTLHPEADQPASRNVRPGPGYSVPLHFGYQGMRLAAVKPLSCRFPPTGLERSLDQTTSFRTYFPQSVLRLWYSIPHASRSRGTHSCIRQSASLTLREDSMTEVTEVHARVSEQFNVIAFAAATSFIEGAYSMNISSTLRCMRSPPTTSRT